MNTPTQIRNGGAIVEPLDKSSVAEMSAGLIDSLGPEELIRVIYAADLPVVFCHELPARLAFCDRETLRRLAHLARRCCRNQGY
jgi:hypothetical protein